MTGETDTAEVGPHDAKAIGPAPGIALTPESAHGMGVDMNRLGAWVEHGRLGFNGECAALSGEAGSNASYAMVPGVPADLPLSAFVTRFGIMVGAPTVGDDRGGCPAGTATLVPGRWEGSVMAVISR